MTLSTDIYIKVPVNGPELHRWVNEELLRVPSYDDVIYSEKRTATENFMNNRLGQGFDAIFDLDWTDSSRSFEGYEDYTAGPPSYYYTDGELSDESREEWDREVESFKQERDFIGEYYAHIDFDTAYGFRSPFGGYGCTELHVLYILKLADRYGPENILWKNEYEGTYATASDNEAFQKFLGNGDAAMEWFSGVKRVIEDAFSDLTREGDIC